jgi:predicted DNA-binding protein
MIKVNHFLTEKQLQYLRDISKDTGLSVAEIIRRLIDKHIKEGNNNV